MAIYISELALEKIPSNKFVSVTTSDGNYQLRSELFKTNRDLVNLVTNPFRTLPVQKDDRRPGVVRRIQMALKIISQLPNINYNLPGGFTLNSEFNPVTEQAVKDFQQKVEIDITGIVDALTLSWLDLTIADHIYDMETGEHIADKSDRDNKFVSFSDTLGSDGLYKYNLTYIDSNKNMQTVEVKDKSIHYVQVLKETGQKNATVPISGINNITGKNLDISRKKYNDGSVLLRDKNNKQIRVFAPPRLPESEPYEVKNGDNIYSIINKYYYVDHDIEYMTGEGVMVHKVPKRLSSTSDTRVRFYMLVLYFFNLNTKREEGPIKFNNLGKNDAFYKKLEKVFIHENKRPATSGTSSSKLPNFYNFVKSINEYSNVTTGMTVTPGMGINVPSKAFVEMLYYHLNFNPDLMLSGGTYVTSVPDVRTEITQEIQQRKTLGEVFFDFVDDAVSTAADKIMDFYRETLSFFKSAYVHLRNQLLDKWPRGLGSHIKVGASVTWGIPLKTGTEGDFFMWRKVTERNKLVICMAQWGKFEAGVDDSLGIELTVGLGAAKRNKKLNLGLKIEGDVEASALGYVEGKIEYEFPVEPNNTALISMCMAAMAPMANAQTQLGALMANKVLQYFKVVDLSPFQYMIKANLTLGAKLSASGNINGVLDIRSKSEPGEEDQFVDDEELTEKKNNLSTLNQILHYLDFNFEFGLDCKSFDLEYTASYPEGVLDPKVLTRQPSGTEIQLGNAIAANVKIENSPGLRKLLDVTNADIELPDFEFDRAVALYTKFVLEEELVNGVKRLKIKDRLYKVGTSTGSVDYNAEGGDEFFIHLDKPALLNILSNPDAYTPADAINLIKSIQYRKKEAIEGDAPVLESTVIESLTKWYKSKKIMNTNLGDLVMEELGLQFNASYDIDINLDIENNSLSGLIKDSILCTVNLLMWWDGLISDPAINSNPATMREIQKWLYENVYLVFQKTTNVQQTQLAILTINTKLNELVNKVKNTNIGTSSGTINIFDKYNYNSSNVNKLDYVKRYLNVVFTMVERTIEYTRDGIQVAGWVMDILFTKIFRFLVDSLEITFALEGSFEAAATVNAKLGEAVAKEAVTIDLQGGLFDRSLLIDKNQMTVLANGDPMKGLIDVIRHTLGQDYRKITDLLFDPSK